MLQFLEPTLVSPAGASGGHDADGPATHLRAGASAHRVRAPSTSRSLITHRYRSLEPVPAAFAGDHRLPDYVKGVVATLALLLRRTAL